jgi:hypothetical protein
MRWIKLFEDYTITKIHKNTPGNYQYCDGIKYKLGNEAKTLTLSINQVQNTVENTFYPDQIEKYKDYISNGGVIETFPVEENSIANNLEDMLEWLEDSDNFDTYYNLLNGTILYPASKTEMERAIDKALGKTSEEATESKPIYCYDLFDKEEHPEYSRINKRAYNLQEVFPPDNRTPKEIELINVLKPIFEYFDEEKEYHLLDFNHRFEAVRALGKKSVVVEIM